MHMLWMNTNFNTVERQCVSLDPYIRWFGNLAVCLSNMRSFSICFGHRKYIAGGTLKQFYRSGPLNEPILRHALERRFCCTVVLSRQGSQ